MQLPALRTRVARSPIARVFSRFAAGSFVASGCSWLAFLLLFGVLGASAAVSGALAFLAGAIPNFVLQRYWTWKRSGRIGLRAELAPYVAVITFNGLLATGVTAGADRLIGSAVDSHATRTLLLTAAFTATYTLLFVVKFVLLDRLVFGAGTRRERRSRHQVPTITRA